MYLKKCPYCKSSDVKKSGLRNHIQHYKCKSCGKQFQNKPPKPSMESIWSEYLNAKQTILEIAKKHHISESTVKRILRKKADTGQQPDLTGMSGYVHMDATYWGHNWGIMLCINSQLVPTCRDKDGKTCYLHRRVRTVMNSIDFYLPYLFTYQRTDCVGMPNTNNKIEGTYTDLTKNLNNHSGLTIEHRKQFITAYFQSKPDGHLS